ncbi:hypothetical protein [uncultured Sphingomonas sp.]
MVSDFSSEALVRVATKALRKQTLLLVQHSPMSMAALFDFKVGEGRET